MKQQKLIRGPVVLEEMHSSGKTRGSEGGKNFYLENAIPGETVTYTLERRKRGFLQGQPEEIVSPSSFRVDPLCRHAPVCGGCPWQHMDYSGQLRFKRDILIKALEKYEILTPPVPGVIPSPGTLFYRHRMEYAFSANGKAGFHAAGDPGRIHAIDECFMQPEPSRRICLFIEEFSRKNGISCYDAFTRQGLLRSLSIRVNQRCETMVVTGFAEDNPHLREMLFRAIKSEFPEVISLNHTIHLSHEHSQLQGEIIPYGNDTPFIYEDVGNIRFRIHASSFFQPNVKQAEHIFETARYWADLSGTERVYDLYTGVGTLALYLAADAGFVTGIEGSDMAIKDARENARLNHVNNVDFICGDILETFRDDFVHTKGKPDLVLLDPPRSGTLIEIKKTILNSGAEKVIYLSCNPVSLSWDLKQLSEKYSITRIQPFDMLPQTHHLETLVLLEKNG
jgi:23S rRNA (uracil1939-C5)-methyltransferase